jgi:hypothetical protein
MKEGKDLGTVSRFLQVQTTDFSSIPDENVVKQMMRDERPDYSQEEINELFEMEYPSVGADEDGEIDSKQVRQRELRIKEAARRAREHFSSKKVDLDSLSKERQEQQVQSQQSVKQTQEAWGQVIDKLVVPKVQKTAFKVESNDFTYEVEVPLDEGLVNEVRNQLMKQDLGNIPMNEHGLSRVQKIAEQFARAMSFEKTAETIARDAYAKGRKAALQEAGGPPPASPPRRRPPVVQPGKAPKGFV